MSYIDLYFDKHYDRSVSTDATLFGVPFDSTHSFRPGTRFAPNAIRELFNNIELFMPEFAIDLEKININDIGNIKHTVVPTEMLNVVSKVTSELIKIKKQLFILGGEHLITLGSYTSFPSSTGCIIFDAHYDLRNEYADAKLSHATYLRRIIEKKESSENIIHVGARAFSKEEQAYKINNDIKTISNNDIRDGLGPKLVGDMCSIFDRIYLSIDMDVLDPAYAPGVGNPEAVGITSRELFDMVYTLNAFDIVCTDIVELCPTFDNGSTTSIAARLLSYILSMNTKITG